ncbi:MAG: methyltransferase family protein [Candidatus Helarchaeota archaeon]
MGKFEHIKAIIMLPCIVLIVFPLLLLTQGFVIGSISFKGIQKPIFRMHFGLDLKPLLNLIPIIVSILIIGSGLALLIKTNLLFSKLGKGTLSPLNPPKKLVIIGPYLYTRNPMILGVFLILLGESLLFGSFPIFLWAVFFIGMDHLYTIAIEEKSLIERFGQDYQNYMKKVPRWIPRLKKSAKNLNSR